MLILIHDSGFGFPSYSYRSDGNSSVSELEVRVETLEGIAADHETRISTVESDVIGIPFLFIVTLNALVTINKKGIPSLPPFSSKAVTRKSKARVVSCKSADNIY